MKVLRKTKSPCPECLKILDAEIMLKDNGVYLQKTCDKHGKHSILVSSSKKYYEELHAFYFALDNLPRKKPREILKEYIFLYLTLRCNNNCPICYNKSNSTTYKEPTLKDIRKFVKQFKSKEIIPFGGEPTLREDLGEILKIIKQSGNIPTIFTNGLLLSNDEYLKRLTKSGLKQVRFSFLGFRKKYYKLIEGHDLLSKKIKTLDNLNRYKIPTTLECTICNNVNKENMAEILEYCVNNDFVKAVMFRPYAFLGNKGLQRDYSTNPTDLILSLEKQTNKRISEKDVIDFQRILFMLADSLNKKICLYQPYIILWRNKKGYTPITRMLNIKSLKKKSENYLRLRRKNQFLAKLYLFSFILLPSINIKNFNFFFNSILINMFERFNLSNVSRHFLLVSFPVNCGPDVYDSSLEKNCTATEYMFGCEMNNLANSNLQREKRFRRKNN